MTTVFDRVYFKSPPHIHLSVATLSSFVYNNNILQPATFIRTSGTAATSYIMLTEVRRRCYDATGLVVCRHRI